MYSENESRRCGRDAMQSKGLDSHQLGQLGEDKQRKNQNLPPLEEPRAVGQSRDRICRTEVIPVTMLTLLGAIWAAVAFSNLAANMFFSAKRFAFRKMHPKMIGLA